MAKSDDRQPSPAEWRERYAEGPNTLDTALAGLSEADLDVSVASGEWTIREIVNHLAEVEIRATFWMTVAMGNPGATFSLDWFPGTNKAWGSTLRFDCRPIEPSLAMIREVRAYFLAQVQAVPDAGERYVLTTGGEIGPEPTRFSVDDGIRGYVNHLDEHLATIRTIRQLHGI